MAKKPTVLIALDGFANRENEHGNVVKLASKPNFDRYYNKYPTTQIETSGLDVGLPGGQMGNPEVGHMNIGAGCIVYQSLTRINKSIEDGDFFENDVLSNAIAHVNSHDSALYIFGLLSDGGAHSHYKYLFVLLELAKKQGVEKVYVHALLDGHDVDQKPALKYIEEIEAKFNESGIDRFVSVSGRYYAMDRDKRWECEEKAYSVIRNFDAPTYATAKEGVGASYNEDLTDEFVVPFIAENQNDGVNDGGAVIFYNFRPDRAAQLSEIFANRASEGFKAEQVRDLFYVAFTKYNGNIDVAIVFEKVDLNNIIGEIAQNNNLTQLRTAETEKYPHVTYSMSGGRNEEFKGEHRRLIDSSKVAMYDLKPEMSAYEVKDALSEELNKGDLDLIILNFANPDMVGHGGMLEPTIKAIEAVDECLGEVVDKILDMDGYAIITVDHDNSDQILTDDDQPMTTHTTNPVSVIVTKEGATFRGTGHLSDLVPILSDLLNVEQPEGMTGESLIRH